jgi:hypothetical protein
MWHNYCWSGGPRNFACCTHTLRSLLNFNNVGKLLKLTRSTWLVANDTMELQFIALCTGKTLPTLIEVELEVKMSITQTETRQINLGHTFRSSDFCSFIHHSSHILSKLYA